MNFFLCFALPKLLYFIVYKKEFVLKHLEPNGMKG